MIIIENNVSDEAICLAAIQKNVWVRRQESLFICSPGEKEKEMKKGDGDTISRTHYSPRVQITYLTKVAEMRVY